MDSLTSSGLLLLLLIGAWVLMPVAVWEMNSKLKKLVKLQTANNETMIEMKRFLRIISGNPLTEAERIADLAKKDPDCVESLIHEGKLIAAGIAFKKHLDEQSVRDEAFRLLLDHKISQKECVRILGRNLSLDELSQMNTKP